MPTRADADQMLAARCRGVLGVVGLDTPEADGRLAAFDNAAMIALYQLGVAPVAWPPADANLAELPDLLLPAYLLRAELQAKRDLYVALLEFVSESPSPGAPISLSDMAKGLLQDIDRLVARVDGGEGLVDGASAAVACGPIDDPDTDGPDVPIEWEDCP